MTFGSWNWILGGIIKWPNVEKRGTLESFNHGYLGLHEFNQMRKHCLGDNMIAIAKESAEIEECVTGLVLELSFPHTP